MALKLKGSTSGFVAIDAPSVAGNNTLILPENTGSAHQILANDITAGVTTFTQITVSRNGDLTVPGTISIGGTLTYEDVTSVDSVGIVTARGLSIFGNTTGLQVASGISTFQATTATTGNFSSNVDIAGELTVAETIAHTGDTNNKISFPAADTITLTTGGSERLRIDSSGRVIITNDGVTHSTGTNTQYSPLTVRGNTSATSARAAFLTFARSEASANIAADEGIGEIWFGDQQAGEYGAIKCTADAAAAVGDYPGRLTFHTTADGGTTMYERLRITKDGNIEMGSSAGTGADFSLLDGMVINTNNGSAGLMLNSSSSSHNAYVSFSYGSGSSTSHADQFSAYVGRIGDNTLILGTNNAPRAQVTSSGHLAPYTNDTYDLGTSSLKWSHVHIDNYVYVGTTASSFKDNQLLFKSSGTAYIDHNTTGQSVQFRTSVSSSLDTNALILTSAGNATFAGTVTDNRGDVRSFPIVNYSSNVVITTSHTGKTLPNTSGGWTLNTSTNWSPGQVMRVVNKSGSSQTVFQASGVTIYSRRDGGTSGDHSIVARGSAIVICTATNEYYISGDI